MVKVKRIIAAILCCIAAPSAAQQRPIAIWKTHYEHSPASGSETCIVGSFNETQPVVAAWSRTPKSKVRWIVMIGTDRHPGRSQYLLVDDQRFQTSGAAFSDTDSLAIVNALKQGKSFAFEWVKWPSDRRTGQMAVGNFAAIAAECERKIK